MTLRIDNAKASLTDNNFSQQLSTLKLDIIHNSNNSNAGLLSFGGLDLNSQDLGKLTINFIKQIKGFKRPWQVTSSFHKTIFDRDFSQNSKLSCPEVEDSESSIIISIIYMKSGLKI